MCILLHIDYLSIKLRACKRLNSSAQRCCLLNQEKNSNQPPFSGSWASPPRQWVISHAGVLDGEPKTTAVSHQMPRHLWLRAKLSHPYPQSSHSQPQKENSPAGQNTTRAPFSTLCKPFWVSCRRRNRWEVTSPTEARTEPLGQAQF